MNRTAAVLAVALLPLCGAIGCGGARQPAAGAAAAPRPVTLIEPRAATVPEVVAVTGTLAPHEELVLGFQVAGRLAELAVDVGDRVDAGALVAALDARDFQLGIDRARAALTSARARLGLGAEEAPAAVAVEDVAAVREAQAVFADAEVSRVRLEELVRQNLRSAADLDAAAAAVAVARSRLQAAHDTVRTWIAEVAERQVDLELAQKRARDARLLSPWPGLVAQRTAAPGRYLQVGEAVVTLLRVEPLRLRLRVPERLTARLAIGQRVEFDVDGVDVAAPHTGTVARLGAAIDRDDRTLLVEAEVANADQLLRAGGFCRARIVTAAARPVLAVPAAAVQSFAGVQRLFTVENGRAVELLVELGERLGDDVEVRSGLTAAQRIVVEPKGLVQGAAVAAKD